MVQGSWFRVNGSWVHDSRLMIHFWFMFHGLRKIKNMNEIKNIDFATLIAECTAYDFKEMLEEKKPKSWLKSVSAFANTLGGSLFFGIDNDGVVKGLEDVQHVTEAISMKIRDYMDPLPEVEAIPLETEGKQVLQLKVNAGSYTPYYYVGDGQRVAFVRNGDESIPATGEQMVRLVLKGSNQTYDSLRTDKRVEDHSFAILANTFKERTGQDWDRKYLLSFGLVTDDGYLTNAGALFADNCWLSQSRLYCTRWDGLEKTDAINDAEFKGNILLLLREAMAFAKANTRKGWEKLPDGRKNKPEYAERAVLEGCVNHLIHRDYTMMGGEVHLDIYDDRLALTSPGGMYSGQMVQDVPVEDISSLRRNPVLADVMAQLDYMEKRGSGLKKICNATKELETYKEGRDPVFKSSVSQFMTVIYSMEYQPGKSGQLNGTLSGTLNGILNDTLNEKQNKVLDFIAASPGVQAQIIIDQLAIPRDTLNKILKVLTDRELIERRGSKKTGGYYVKK